MKPITDGPISPNFRPVPFAGHIHLDDLSESTAISTEMAAAVQHAPGGECVAWGIPFEVGKVVVVSDVPVSVALPPTQARWFVFMHTSDVRPLERDATGFISPTRGAGQLNEHAANYVLLYEDGAEARVEIRRRHHLGTFRRGWGENCFQAVAHHKPHPLRAPHEQLSDGWGWKQTRAAAGDEGPWVNWLWAWENPHSEKAVVGVRIEPVAGTVVVSAISAGSATDQPLRWLSRRKALLVLPEGVEFAPELNNEGLLAQIQLDMGQVISASPRLVYPNATWGDSYNNQVPEMSECEVLIEYTAHPDANFHLWDGRVVPVADLSGLENLTGLLGSVAPATQRVNLKVVEKDSGKLVAVKLHIHGEAGEYLAPVDRHRIINPSWFEDYSVDFAHRGLHQCTYITGETIIDLPMSRVYIEVSKGFEIRPVRKVIGVTAETTEIEIEIEKVLPWREKGWVTADTHVHFLSPMSALLEGAGEGVNVVNLLASQWGELMTNVGDFDGKNTWGSRENGGDGEYLVRVGTENRQHVMGHISLLGYRGGIIAPMTTGGPDESAIGDPIEILLTEWARQCKRQGGLVVLPHFPNPRAEHAASIISGDIDAVEMTSWGNLYGGINPYSLSDWYRYLNCGYLVPAVGGTDKMSADTAVGTVRTYAHVPARQPFTYDAWMDAVRRAETFVTYGPLLEFAVDGKPMGSRIPMTSNGGTVDVVWQVASVTVPVSRVELVVNGEIRESVAVDAGQASGTPLSGSWSVKIDRSSWLALLVRGHYADKPEIIAAHSSTVMVDVEGSQMLAAADAVTILEQIEGALAYLDTVGTRAEDRAYKRMRLVLESAHRSLHNRMHRLGYYHNHTPVEDHPAHH
ncbi:MAG: CehA/McbA family metallohydrolase [Anaerolineae bacterium]|nr:CehA/McbA family metallohydrolase [Anaerolineae bacterium]